MHSFYVALFFACAILFLVPERSCIGIFDEEDDEVEKGDKFIDDLLKDMFHDHGHEYDPYIMEDSRIGFNKKIMFVNVSGEAKLHNGYIAGLKSLHRPDHCSLKEVNDRLRVSADLGAGTLDLRYDGTVKFMNWGPTIRCHGEIAYVETHMKFTVDAKTGKGGRLTAFTIDDMKGMKVEITGLGPLNWVMNYLVSGVTSLFKGYLRGLLEKKVRNHIAERLPNYQFPVKGVDPTQPPETTFQPETEPETNPEPETEPEVETKSETEPETDPEPEVETEAETEPERETESETDPEPEVETDPEPEVETESETEPERETEPETDPEPEVETESEPETNPEPEPETTPEREPELETEPEDDLIEK